MRFQHIFRKAARHAATSAGLTGMLLLAGCIPATTGGPEGIGFRQARFQEISAMRAYRGCVDDALKVAEDARPTGNVAAYRTSAKIIEKCEADLGPEGANIAQEERMRAYAVGILNYIKAGDIEKARSNLETFVATFDGYDLYMPDGASFVDTVELLTKTSGGASSQQTAMLNISPTLRSEMQRVRFWKHN